MWYDVKHGIFRRIHQYPKAVYPLLMHIASELLLAGKLLRILKVFCGQQTKRAVLSISLLLKCHSLLHLLNMLMGEFGLQLLFMLTLGDFFTSCKVCLASLFTA